MKNLKFSAIFAGLVLILAFSGCVEQKKDVDLMLSNEISYPVNFSPIIIYGKFNESVNGTVNFYINDRFIGSANSNNTDVFMYYNGTLVPGSYKIKVEFPGNDKFNNASAFSVLKIYKLKPSLSIGVEPEGKIYFKDALNVSVSLRNERECANKEILVYVNDDVYKNFTDEECEAKFFVKNLKKGYLNISALYKGNEIYEDANASVPIEVISKIPVKIFGNDIEVESKEKNVSIYGDVKDYLGRDISNWTLKIMHNGRIIGNLTSHHKNYVLNISNWTTGTYLVSVVFDGDEIYENSSKDIFIQILNKYNISGVEVKSEIQIEEMRNRKVAVYTDISNVSDYCAYELESIADQKGGYKLQIQKGNQNAIFIGKNFGIITIKQENVNDYSMLPCHVFLCINKNINCSIIDVIDEIGNLENFSIAIDQDITNKKILNEYTNVMGALGYIQAYLEKNGKKVYINQYIINKGKCQRYQNLTEQETNDCNFSGIFIKKGEKRVMITEDRKILLEGDDTGLLTEMTILKWIISPDYAYYLRTGK